MELGLYTFADSPVEGNIAQNNHQRIKNLMEEIKLADQVGLDVFGVGEHHRKDYAISSPAIILAAAAVKTKNIKLTSAVTVLSSDDPVRVYQDFATIDHLSNGRAEIMAGRGSYIESFPLFGFDLQDYDTLFAEKLALLLKVNKVEIVSSQGVLRPSISGRGVYPRAFQKQLPVWLAVGGTPASAVRAAKNKLPMAVAIIGGAPQQFVQFVNFYRETAKEAGHNLDNTPLSINSIGYVGDSSKQAADEFFPAYSGMMDKIGKERGWSPMTRDQYDHLRSAKGALVVGSPEEVVDKILYEHELFGNSRFLLQMSVGNMPHDKIMRAIELYGTKVAPEVRKAIGEKKK